MTYVIVPKPQMSLLLMCAGVLAQEEFMSESATLSLYEQLGGEPAVNAAVDNFYCRVLADDRVNHWFEGTDMERQAAKQKAFLTMAFGGPNNYTGMDMKIGHAHLVAKGLNDADFDAIVENLGTTLKEMGVPDNLIAQVAATAETTREAVLGRI